MRLSICKVLRKRSHEVRECTWHPHGVPWFLRDDSVSVQWCFHDPMLCQTHVFVSFRFSSEVTNQFFNRTPKAQAPEQGYATNYNTKLLSWRSDPPLGMKHLLDGRNKTGAELLSYGQRWDKTAVDNCWHNANCCPEQPMQSHTYMGVFFVARKWQEESLELSAVSTLRQPHPLLLHTRYDATRRRHMAAGGVPTWKSNF